MSSFVAHLPPTASLSTYQRSVEHTSQPPSVPQTFLDAMSIREAVYVAEQQIPLENEFDTDDPRSHHWVAYASVGSITTSTTSTDARKDSAGSKLPVGTIRLVPPPHPTHEDRSSATLAKLSDLTEEDRRAKGCLRRGMEPYVKLGRLAVRKEFRKLGLSRLLVDAAVVYTAENAGEVVPAESASVVEGRRVRDDGGGGGAGVTGQFDDGGAWDGLILVHAQVGVEKLWRGWGFVADETMGRWDEEGIEHLGMWKRVEVKETGAVPLELRPVRSHQ